MISGFLSFCASVAFLLAVYFEYSILDALYNNSSIPPSAAAVYMLASVFTFLLLTFLSSYVISGGDMRDEEGGRFFDGLGIFLTAGFVSLLLIVAVIATGAYD